jgi:hypothetical protein
MPYLLRWSPIDCWCRVPLGGGCRCRRVPSRELSGFPKKGDITNLQLDKDGDAIRQQLHGARIGRRPGFGSGAPGRASAWDCETKHVWKPDDASQAALREDTGITAPIVAGGTDEDEMQVVDSFPKHPCDRGKP